MTKKCFKCGQVKPLSQFYRHAQMGDGHLNKCKTCTKSDVAIHRGKNLDRIQEYDRQRGQLERRKAANRKRYKERTSTVAGKKQEYARSKEWRDRNWKKRAVHNLVSKALERGRIIRPIQCERCGAEKPDAHHEDYNKPFEITWLCKPCHGARHRELNEKKR